MCKYFLIILHFWVYFTLSRKFFKQNLALSRKFIPLKYVLTRKSFPLKCSLSVERFPEDFMFQLTKEEAEFSRSQFVMLNEDGDNSRSQNATLNGRGHNIKHLPYAFTENKKWFGFVKLEQPANELLSKM